MKALISLGIIVLAVYALDRVQMDRTPAIVNSSAANTEKKSLMHRTDVPTLKVQHEKPRVMQK